MSFTKVEVPGLKFNSKVRIKPYFDPNVENMGLENYGMALHEGVYHTEQLACLEKNGIKKWVTGLNEFDASVKFIADPEEKEAKIKQIRTTVAELERLLAANDLKIDDEDFWNKVKLLHPSNDEFWSKIELKAGNDTVFLDPKDPYDLIKLHAIEAGGFSIIAPSYQSAKDSAKPPKFYLDVKEETIATKNESRKIRNKALAELQSMFDKNSSKLFYTAKIIASGSAHYTHSTPNEELYEVMDDYINGLGAERSKKVAAQKFLDTSRKTVKQLKLAAIVKDAAFYKIIVNKADGHIYHAASNSMMGRNVSDVIEFLGNALNEQILVDIQADIEAKWNK